MSFLRGLAEQALSSATSGGSSANSDQVRRTGGQEYNTPYHSQQPRGGYNTQEVLSHAGARDSEDGGFIAKALQHVHANTDQHQQEVSESDLTKYGPLIMSALASFSSKSGSGSGSSSGFDIASLMSGSLGEGGGNQVMGLVMKQVGSAVGGGGEDKQGMMNGAAMTLTKLVVQNQLSSFTGGSNSGGLGAMMNIGGSLLKSRFG